MPKLCKEAIERQETILRQAISQLNDGESQIFHRLIQHQLKDSSTYSACACFCVSAQHVYLGYWKQAIASLSAFFGGIILIILGGIIFTANVDSLSFATVSGVLLVLLGILVILVTSITEMVTSLTLSRWIVQDYNNKVMEKALQKVNGGKPLE